MFSRTGVECSSHGTAGWTTSGKAARVDRSLCGRRDEMDFNVVALFP